MKTLFLAIALFSAVALAEEKSESAELVPGGEAFVVESVNYPEDASANLKQTWKLTTTAGNFIHLECTDIRLFEDKPCGDWALTFDDGGNVTEMCTTSFDHKFTSKTNTLTLTLRTGRDARGFVACKATATKK
uniref:Venom CUB domain-containing protein 2 n=1 Tax=Platymeris rhadamanthus TaxID=1134088 RepID=CUB2_PLARH|nr:RecName: Full=Venom CUB domain-containing protein 2; Flags: Precursor [Platymeris rhadamanthus]QHB21496.1 venom CUB domain protein 2 [Platymeris rhadamanthus]